MNNKITALFALTLLAFSISNAEYRMYIPAEVKLGGSLPTGSISFVKPTDGGNNGGGVTPVEPEVPTDPTTPEEPSQPETKPRSLVFSGDFQTVAGESNLWTTGMKDVYEISSYMLVLKGAYQNGKTYYIGNNGSECPFIAEVCTTNDQKMCGPYNSNNFSGQNTIFYKDSRAARTCIDATTNFFTSTKSVKGLQVFDGPETE